jgi:DNA polymerase-3 subunit delta'
MAELLPWLQPLWQDLQHRVAAQSLPHALLLSSPRGYGKACLAQMFARSLLCQHPLDEGRPCGKCSACHLLAAGTHPDFLYLTPEEEGKVIAVDRVRALGDFLALKGQYGNRQIIIIEPAEAMNRFAANSLLKTLEEPSPEALLILVSNRPSMLLATIRSRCQHMQIPRPEPRKAETWLVEQLGSETDASMLLSLADGAPLLAREMHESGRLTLRTKLARQWLALGQGAGNPLDEAGQWAEIRLPMAIQWLASWTMDLIRLKSGADAAAIVNCDLLPTMQRLASGVDIQQLFGILEQITEYSRWADSQLNPQLVMEDILLSWYRLGTRGQGSRQARGR